MRQDKTRKTWLSLSAQRRTLFPSLVFHEIPGLACQAGCWQKQHRNKNWQLDSVGKFQKDGSNEQLQILLAGGFLAIQLECSVWMVVSFSVSALQCASAVFLSQVDFCDAQECTELKRAFTVWKHCQSFHQLCFPYQVQFSAAEMFSVSVWKDCLVFSSRFLISPSSTKQMLGVCLERLPESDVPQPCKFPFFFRHGICQIF